MKKFWKILIIVLLVLLFYLTREVRGKWAIQLVGLALF